MRKLFTIVVLVGIAAAIGYLVATEDGRAKRDAMLARARGGATDPSIDLGTSDTSDDLETTESVTAT